jgi:xanthine dehydrogenase accessory factor
MITVLDHVEEWSAHGHRAALATVIATERSTPRDPGAAMAVREDGTVAGSVSGGCVEGAVVEEALAAIASGEPRRLRYGISDELAGEVGLTCGGTVHLFVEPLDAATRPLLAQVRAAVRDGRPVALVTEIAGPRPGAKLVLDGDAVAGSLSSGALEAAVAADARTMLSQGLTGTRAYGTAGEQRCDDVEVMVQSFAPPAAMLVYGAIDFATALVRLGRFLGYEVTVCDARAPFATRARFPEADHVAVAWPAEHLAGSHIDARTAICVLTHDKKFDVPLLHAALATPAGYIGAMGSRRTHEQRMAALRELGLDERQLARIHGPIGLDLGARTPEEVAVAIAAELIAVRHGRAGGHLRDREGPVRGPADADTRRSVHQEVPLARR